MHLEINFPFNRKLFYLAKDKGITEKEALEDILLDYFGGDREACGKEVEARFLADIKKTSAKSLKRIVNEDQN